MYNLFVYNKWLILLTNPLYLRWKWKLLAKQWLTGKESACQSSRLKFDLWVWKIPQGRKWQPAPLFSPGKSHDRRSLVGHSPWGCKELDTTEQLNNSNHYEMTSFFSSDFFCSNIYFDIDITFNIAPAFFTVITWYIFFFINLL